MTVEANKWVRDILGLRNSRNKFCIDQNFPKHSPERCIINSLLKEKLVTLIDSGLFPHLARVPLDVFLLTPSGVAFCDEHNIPHQPGT